MMPTRQELADAQHVDYGANPGAWKDDRSGLKPVLGALFGALPLLVVVGGAVAPTVTGWALAALLGVLVFAGATAGLRGLLADDHDY